MFVDRAPATTISRDQRAVHSQYLLTRWPISY